MYYHEFDPAPGLAAHVASYWMVSVDDSVSPEHRHHVLPDGCMALVVVMAANGTRHVVLQGPHSTPMVIPVSPGDRYWGVRFWPDAGGLVTGVDPRSMVGQLKPAEVDLGPGVRELPRRLEGVTDPAVAARHLDEIASSYVLRSGISHPDPQIRAAVMAIIAANGGAPIGELAASVGLSPRQFQRRFVAAVGLAPKVYSRIRRLRASLGHLIEDRKVTWSTVAADLGYSDHAHLVREFTRLARLTPEEVARQIRSIGHGRVRP
ncbi:MAG TPA: AraC family transcriptional regulator [Gemmatimonadaceae bacterium]